MPSLTIAPWLTEAFFDTNGAPYASGTVETYEAGTSTPLATYSDSAGLVANPTTITLNAAGRPQVSGVDVAMYCAAQAYKFVLKNSAGTIILTRDNIIPSAPVGAGNLEVSGVVGEDVSANDCLYLSDGSNSLVAGRWYKADADAYYSATNALVGFATTAASTGATITIRTGGAVTGLSALVAGSSYFVSGTAGQITATAPQNMRAVGVAASSTVLNLGGGLALGTPVFPCDGRLTLTTGLPVTTADVTAAGTIYFAPYEGNSLAVYDGTAWRLYAFSQLSLALTVSSGSNYDVFVYDNAGTLTLELSAAWNSATARFASGAYATLLPTQDGVKVKSTDGAAIDPTRRYLGTIRGSGTNTTEDSIAKRYLSNYYNRVRRQMYVLEATNSWTYTLATLRQVNAAAANQLDFVVGVDEDTVSAMASATATNALAVNIYVGIGLDSTSANATGVIAPLTGLPASGVPSPGHATWEGHPGVGRHVLVWLEGSGAAGTTTWYGDNNAPSNNQSGIRGVIWN
jgi:hypothetical protein